MMKTGLRSYGKEIGLVIVGTLVLALGTAFFLLPYDLIAGGVSGIAIILHSVFPGLSEQRAIAALTWGLFFFGWWILGTRFAWRTFLSGAIYPIGIALFSHFAKELRGGTSLADQLCAAAVGGVLVGIGCALTVIGGGSTGGTDVLAFVACKVFPGMRHAAAMLLVDAAIIGTGILVLRQPAQSLSGIVSATVSAVTVDYALRIGRTE